MVQAEVVFPFDADKLFADHAALVELRADGAERLVLPGGVEVIRSESGISARDASGPVGCYLADLLAYKWVIDQCSPFLPPEENLVARRIERVVDFAAQNAYPPISGSDVRIWFDAHSSQPSLEDFSCREVEADGSLAEMKEALLATETEAAIASLLAAPRLPVLDPCH
jgi:hypothetical protein